MNVFRRVANIITKPALEWPVIAAEASTSSGIVAGYLAPLAAIGPIATFVSFSVIGVGVPFVGTYRTGNASGVVTLLTSFAVTLVSALLLAACVNVLAPSFGGTRSWLGALKVTAYSLTPPLVASVAFLFPVASALVLVAAAYAYYLFYLGLPAVMGAPRERVPVYTFAVVLCGIVLSLVVVYVAFSSTTPIRAVTAP